MNPSKLKVVELRAELASRGLDTKGNKAVLVDRLQEALDKESGTVTERKPQEDSDEAGDNTVNDTLNTSQPESNPDESDSEPAKSAPVSEAVDQNQQSQEEEDSREESEQRKSLDGKEQDKAAPEESDTCKVKKESVDSNHHQEKNSENTKMDVDGDKEIKKEGFESEIKTEPRVKSENDIKEDRDIKEERDYGRDDRKRKRSSSPKRDFSRGSKEDEPECNDNDVVLSWYDSDLNLIVEKNGFLKACPMTNDGFGFIWAGVRGTFGYTSGNLCYQVKLTEYCDVSHLENEPTPNVLRVGWSALGTSLQLGEEPLSYGFGGTGKIAVNCKFRDYGKPFGLNDIVTAYISFNNGDVSMSYAVNQDFLGEAFRVNESELKGKALAPHILSKNVRFEVNFGQEDPWVPVRDGYSFLNTVPAEQAVPGPRRPEKKGECEMIMMCGLPGCGKTYWANKHVADNPDKLYNILGTNALIDKMKVMGLPRKANYSGRWDLLIEKCTKCLQKLMDIGCRRRRNYILDQTNVYPAAQRRKMRNFEGFIRKAVVIVPTDEEFKRRVSQREEVEGKDVPDSAVMEMKANFTLPDKKIFNEVIFTELDEEESRKMVRKYNDEAVTAGYKKKPPPGPPKKQFRLDSFGRGGGQHGGRHDGFRPRSSGPPGGGFRRGGGGGGGGGGGRGGGGGWNQRPGGGGGGGGDRWRNDNRGGFRSGGGGMGGGGGGFRQGDRGPGGGGGGGGWRSGGGGGDRGPGGGGRGPGGPRDGGGYGDRRGGGGGGYGDRNRGGGGGGDRRGGGGGGGGYNRDRQDRPGGKGGPGGMKRGGGGGGGGSGSMQSSGGNQWGGGGGGGYQGGGGQQGGPAAQQWGGQQATTGWQQNQQQPNQQWAGYQQQQWKGYNQGYNQQGGGSGGGGGGGGGGGAAGYGANAQQTTAGYNQPYGNWQQYGNYGATGYPQWGQQNWQNWYAQNAANNQTQAAIQPPPAK